MDKKIKIIKEKMIKNNNKKIIVSIMITLMLVFSLSSFAYYTNIGKWLDQQKKSHDDGEGQKRLVEDFIEDGCGTDTMLDTVTGLCWTKNLSISNGTKQWALDTSYPEPTWNGLNYSWPPSRVDTDYPAFKVCNDLTTGGKTNWRLPTRAELLTLIDEIGGDGTTCNTLEGFNFTNCRDTWYWSSNERGSSTSSAFFVHLGGGVSDGNDKTKDYYVACVGRNS